MARIARVVAPGLPYHVTHRGNRGQDVFLSLSDRTTYKRWLAAYSQKFGLEVWAYCLMANHIHLIVMGSESDSLARAIGCTHGRYASRMNRLHGWTGHLWENRFFSTPLDEKHLWAAVSYVEMNPVRARIVDNPGSYRWSSARAHTTCYHDPVLSPSRPFPGSVVNWSQFLAANGDRSRLDMIRRNTATGRPSGSPSFVSELERRLGRTLSPRKRGRKPKRSASRA